MLCTRLSRTGFPALLVMLSGCDLFSHDEALGGPYRLVAIDIDEDMSLCRTINDAGDCVGDGLPEATVFAAGINARYVVAARHPYTWPNATDRSVVEYYYVVRTANEALPHGLPHQNIVGPLNARQFDEAKRRLGLPAFTRVFPSLV